MKSISLGILLLLTADHGFAQEKKFFDRAGGLADSVKNYYFSVTRKSVAKPISGSQGPGTEMEVDTVLSYYTASGKLKEKSVRQAHMLNGPYVAYFENGRVKEEGLYQKGYPVGNFMSWYPGGTPQQTVRYVEKSSGSTRPQIPAMINYWDSLGSALVTDGNGFCKCYSTDMILPGSTEFIREDGKVINGSKDSVWSGFKNDTLVFKENYRMGNFLEGTFYDKKQEVHYHRIEEQPEYEGGINEMMNFLIRTMHYPREDRKHGNAGRVFVGFIVETDGSISEVKVIKGVSQSIDREASRVVNAMPKWKPGKYRGMKVRVRFVLPINFKLS